MREEELKAGHHSAKVNVTDHGVLITEPLYVYEALLDLKRDLEAIKRHLGIKDGERK